MWLYRLNESDSSLEDAVINQFKKDYSNYRSRVYPDNPNGYPITDLKIVGSSKNNQYDIIVLTDTSDTIAMRILRYNGSRIDLTGYYEAFITTIKDMNGDKINGTLIRQNLYDPEHKCYYGNFYEGSSALRKIRRRILNAYNKADSADSLKPITKSVDIDDDKSLVAHYNYDVTGIEKNYNTDYPGNIPDKLYDSTVAVNKIANKGIWSSYRADASHNGWQDRPYSIELYTKDTSVLDDTGVSDKLSLHITINSDESIIEPFSKYLGIPITYFSNILKDIAKNISNSTVYKSEVIVDRPIVMRDFRVIEKVVANHSE